MISAINLILLLLVAVFAIHQYKKYNGKPFRYFVGSMLIMAGIIFIEPSPDIISFGVYALVHNTTYSAIMNPATFSLVLWDYELWSIPIGIGLVLFGMYLLKLNFKQVWKKLNLEKYWIAIALAVLVVIFVVYMIINGVINLNSLSSINNFIKSMVWIIFLILPLAYYFLFRRDISESLSILTTEIILWITGFANMMLFVLQKSPIPDVLPCINSHPIIAPISHLFGYSIVTNVSLLISVFIGVIIVYISNKILKEKF